MVVSELQGGDAFTFDALRRGGPTKLSLFVFDPDHLVWTSREEVTSLLLSALDSDSAHATCAMHLCTAFAPPSAATTLLSVALAKDRPYWARVYALRGCAAMGALVPDDALDSLLAQWFFARNAPPGDGSERLALSDVLSVVTTPAHERLTMEWLSKASPDARASALIQGTHALKKYAPHTMAWLGDEWLAREGDGCSEEVNRRVARSVFADRPEGLRVLQRYWHDRPRQTADFDYDRWCVPALDALIEDRWWVAYTLHLPLTDLLRTLTPRGLRNSVRRAVSARSRQLAREDFTRAAEPVAEEYRRALRLLPVWSEGPDVLCGLLRGVALAPEVRADLVRALLTCAPHRAIELVASRAGSDDNLPSLRVVLNVLAASGACAQEVLSTTHVPRVVADGTAARDLAVRALRERDGATRYLAIEAVEATGDPPAMWRETLRALSGSGDELVRVRAEASLARLGEHDAEVWLACAAVDARRVEVRAEALRRLGELPSAADHLALFDRALATDHAGYGDDALDRLAAEQAALALARLGGAAAMTVLLRRAFGPVTPATTAVIRAGLRVEAEGGESLPSEARARRVRDEEGGRLSRWSPLFASRLARWGE